MAMRIIAGEFRSRKLLPPPEEAPTRPIPDRVKESLFSILRGHVEGALVFDAFAGTGSIGLEALSRGAARCVCVERDRAMAAVLEKNIRTLGVSDRCDVVIGDALGAGALARCPRPATIIMLDPPYALMRDPLGSKRIKGQMAALVKCLADDGFLVLRTPWPLDYSEEVEVAPVNIREPYGARRAGSPARGGKRGRGEEGPATPDAARGGRDAKRPPSKGRWDEVWTIEKNAPEDLTNILAGAGDLEKGGSADEEPAADGAGAPAVKPASRPIDLEVEGAVGPETHAYGTMAMHFYMRKK